MVSPWQPRRLFPLAERYVRNVYRDLNDRVVQVQFFQCFTYHIPTENKITEKGCQLEKNLSVNYKKLNLSREFFDLDRKRNIFSTFQAILNFGQIM